MSDNAALVRSLYEAFARGDVPAVLGAMADDVEWHEAEHVTYWPGGPFIGPRAVLEGVFAPLMRDFDGFRIEVQRIISGGDAVVVEARYHATAKATGKPLNAQVAHVWDFRNGKLVRFQQYTDTWQFAQVTAVAPLTTAAST